MAGPKDVVRQQLETAHKLIAMYTADVSVEECFQPAVQGTNHIGWNLGHIAWSEDSLVALITGRPKRLPETMRETFDGGSTCVPDASAYPSQNELVEMLHNASAYTLETLQGFDEKKWDDPSPKDLPQEFFPTLGSVWGLIATHAFWHIGQITTCRSALKKKRVLE